MKSRISKRALLAGAIPFLLSSTPLLAGIDPESGGAPWHPSGLMQSVLSSALFGLVGIVLAILGFKLFDLVTPFNLEKEMCENKNIAVGILCAAIVLGICHIIAASIG